MTVFMVTQTAESRGLRGAAGQPGADEGIDIRYQIHGPTGGMRGQKRRFGPSHAPTRAFDERTELPVSV